MTRVLMVDFETSGLDHQTDRITEMGVVLWDVEAKRPLTCVDVFFWEEGFPLLSPEITRLTGITDGMLEEFGCTPKSQLGWLERFCSEHSVDYLAGHNIANFDLPFLLAELARHKVDAPTLRSLPILDTRTDLPFATEPDSRKLKHLALDIGVINHFPHRAITDCLTTCLVMSHYSFDQILEYQKIPWITVRALVSYENRELAKAQRFSWETLGDKKFAKWWVKKLKANKFDEEKAACKGFEIARIE